MKPWRSIELGNVVTFQRGFDLPHRHRKMGGVPIVSSAGVTDHHDAAMVSPPGVVTGRYGTIGELFYLEGPFWPLNTTLFVRDFHGNDPRFAFYLLHLFDFQVFSGKSGVPGVNRNDLHAERVTIPTNVAEQSAIATALSDVDALLSSLDALIAKKRDIKQAAMQQLLTGKTRLPGFEGEWRCISAGEIGYFRGGTGFPIAFQGEREGTYPFYKVSDMNNEGNQTFMVAANNWVSDDTRREMGAAVFAPGSIVFAKVGAAVFLERKKILSKPSCIDNNMAAYVIDETKASVPFIHAQLLAKRFGDLVATTALPSLNGKVLAAMPLYVPSSIAEQTAIAEVLSDMDAELAALEARRDKTRLLKQGMMQELLTGKTRLV